MKAGRLIYIKQKCRGQRWCLEQYKEEMLKDLKKQWSNISLYLANENFYEILTILIKIERDAGKRKRLEEIKKHLDMLNFYVANL